MSNILKNLNPEQKKAVTTTDGPLLIIAGAGTGKTTVITRRIAYLIEKKLAKPAEILALTFTEKAAGEMEERVDILVPYGYVDTWISTFHAFGNRILQDHALDIGLTPDFNVLTRPQQVLFFKQNLFAFDLDYYRPLGNPTKFISAIITFISRCKDEDIDPSQYSQYVERLKTKAKKINTKEEKDEHMQEIKRQQELANVYTRYEQFKDEADALDFGDLVVRTLQLFRQNPQILRQYQEKFKYVLVDEFQDSNYAQNELVKLLASKHKNICVTGDDDQSIYKFRGAAISNILEFKKTYPKAKQVVLNRNYRSNQSILDSAYRLIRHNDPDRLEVKHKIDKKLKAIKKEYGLPPQEIYAETVSDEADLVAAEINKLRKKQKLSFKDFAILIRANLQASYFIHALNMYDIPVQFIGASGFYNREEIQLLISFLQAISNFDDSASFYQLITSEIYNLLTNEVIKITDFAKRKNKNLKFVFEKIDKFKNELDLSDESLVIVEKINDDISYFLDLSKKENVGQLLYKFLERSKYLEKLQNEGSVEAQIKVQNISRFFDKITEFLQASQNQSVKQFTDHLQTLRAAGEDPATSEYDPQLDAVNLMTIHSAKGLEFPVVFMVDLISDRFPSRERLEVITLPDEIIKETLPIGDFHMQEERRLFYVGATRAMDLLYFAWSKDVGAKRVKKVSPFVLEALDKTQTDAQIAKVSQLAKIQKFAITPAGQFLPLLPEESSIKLSQGAIDDFLTCEYKYRYVHLLRIPILRHHAVVYGAALHAAVAEFWRAKKSGKNLSLPALLAVFERSWETEGFLSAEHEAKRLMQGKLVLEKFWQREKDSKDLPTYIEQPFSFQVDNILVRGRWDRVDVKPAKNGAYQISILDYKSSEKSDQQLADKDAKSSTQLAVYALAYLMRTGKIPNWVGLYYLESGIVGKHEPTKEEMEETKAKIIEVAKKVRSKLKDDSFEANPIYFGREPACVYCAYNAICPFSLAKI